MSHPTQSPGETEAQMNNASVASSDTTNSCTESEENGSPQENASPLPPLAQGQDVRATPHPTAQAAEFPLTPPSRPVGGALQAPITLSSDDEDEHRDASSVTSSKRHLSQRGTAQQCSNMASLTNIDTLSDRSAIVHSEVDTDLEVPAWRNMRRNDDVPLTSTFTTTSKGGSTTSRDSVADRKQTKSFGCQVSFPGDVFLENEFLKGEVDRLVAAVQNMEISLFRLAAEKAEWTALEEERREALVTAEKSTGPQGINPSEREALQRALQEKTDLIEMLLAERVKLMNSERGGNAAAIDGGGGAVVPPTAPPQTPQPHSGGTGVVPANVVASYEKEISRLTHLLDDTRSQLNAAYAAMHRERESSRQELHDLRCHMQWVYGTLRESDIKGTMEKFTAQLQALLRGHTQAITEMTKNIAKELRGER